MDAQPKKVMCKQSSQPRRYEWKLYPTQEQSAALHSYRHMLGDLWNACIEYVETRRTHGVFYVSYTSKGSLAYEIKPLRAELPEWKAIPATTTHAVLKYLDRAYKAAFAALKRGEKPRFPRFKNPKKNNGMPLGPMGEGWKITQRADNPRSWHFYFKSLGGLVHARGTLPVEGLDHPLLGRKSRRSASRAVDQHTARHRADSFF